MLDRSGESRLASPPAQASNMPAGLPPGMPPYLPGPYATSLVPADTKRLFGRFFKILRRQMWELLLFIAIAMMLALVVQFVFPSLYSSTALLRLDRHSAPGAVGQEASQISAINDMDVIIDTDMELAQSDPVIRPVAEQYHLASKDAPQSFWGGWFPRKAPTDGIRRTNTTPIALSGLRVTRPANTYLIRITYRAWGDPQLAANVANGIAQSLVNHVHESLDRSYDDLSSAMRRDMEQLHVKMGESSSKLTQYEKELEMVDPEQRSTVLTSRLTQLLAEYTAAQADRLHRQAKLEGIRRSPTVSTTQATEENGGRPSLLDESLEHLSAARQQFVAARSYYGENHPEYRKAKQELDEAEAQVERMRVAGNDTAKAGYSQALGRELLLKRQFDETKAEVDRLKALALAYSQLKGEAENDRRRYMELEAHMRDVGVNRQFHDATIQFVAPALPPADAIFPKLQVNLPVTFVVALVLALVGALADDALDTTFSDAEDVSDRMRVEVMGSLPDVPLLNEKRDAPMGILPAVSRRASEIEARYDEAIRMLRNALGRAGLNQPIRTLLITSSVAGEGKSAVAANLGEACAKVGQRVLLIDANLRHPSLHKTFEITTKTGLADVLMQRLSATDVVVESDVPNLFVMPAGPPARDAADLISQGLGSLLDTARAHFDLVILDAPPVLGASESQELATRVDGVVVIAQAKATSAKQLRATLTALQRGRANVLGVVMNRVKFSGECDPAADLSDAQDQQVVRA